MNENNNPENGNGYNPYYSDIPEYTNNGNSANYYSSNQNVNSSGGYYNNNMGSPMPQKSKKGFAIASMILGIVSIFTCCLTTTHFILAVIALIFGIVSLVSKNHGGKGMAITGITTSSVSIVLSIMILLSTGKIIFEFGGFYRDLIKTAVNEKEVVEEYKKTGELPDYLQKYNEGDWGKVFDRMYEGGFEEYFYENFVDDYDDIHDDDRHPINDNSKFDFDNYKYQKDYDFNDLYDPIY